MTGHPTGYGAPPNRVRWQLNKAILAIFVATLTLADSSSADEPPISYPPKPDEKLFSALRKTSPFLRTLNISDTYVLRAVAKHENIAYARVYNRETKKTITIEIGAEPNQGIELIKIVEPQKNDLSSISARISFAGEVSELKYDPAQIDPVSRGGSGKGSQNGDRRSGGDKKGPTSQERDRYKTLSDAQKNRFKEYIKATSKKYPNMPREERGNLIRGALQKLSEGRSIDIPK